TVDNSRRPVINTALQEIIGNNYCFDEDYQVVIRIVNNGTATATNIVYRAGTHYSNQEYGSTHIVGNWEVADDPAFTTNVSTPTTGDEYLIEPGNGNRFGTTGKPYSVAVNIPELAPGQTIYLRYTQRNELPVISCETQVYRILYGSILRNSDTSYQNAEACNPTAPESTYNMGGIATYRDNAQSNFSGSNVGSLEASDNAPYQGQFRIENFYQHLNGITAGDVVEIVLEVSPSLAAGLTAGDITF